MKLASTQYTLEHESFEVYLSGCCGNCFGCHNPLLKDFNIGELIGQDCINSLINKVTNNSLLIKKIWILGGEPLDQPLDELVSLLIKLKETNKELWIWTRYDYQFVPEEIVELCDYIKCGMYMEELRTDDNIQFGIKLATSNQKIYKTK